MTYYKIDPPEGMPHIPQDKLRELGLYAVLKGVMTTGRKASEGDYGRHLDLTLTQCAATICRLALEGDALRRKDPAATDIFSTEMIDLLQSLGEQMMQDGMELAIKEGLIKATEIKPN